MQPNVQVTDKTPTAVSDQARQDPSYKPQVRANRPTGEAPTPGEPYHASTAGFGALGTDGTPPPKSALHYRNDVPQGMTTTPQVPRLGDMLPNNADSVMRQPAVLQPPVIQPSQTTQVDLSPQTTANLQAPDGLSERVTSLETQITSLGTLLATVSNQLQTINGAATTLPGTANPLAPQHHAGSAVQTAAPRVTGPVIPEPMKEQAISADKQDPLKLAGLELQPGEENLTTKEYIEKHFRMRDLSIDQIAYMARMEPQEVIEVLKQLGYQFQDGV